MGTPTPTLDAIRAAYRVIATAPAPAHVWAGAIAREALAADRGEKIGRASCRERV